MKCRFSSGRVSIFAVWGVAASGAVPVRHGGVLTPFVFLLADRTHLIEVGSGQTVADVKAQVAAVQGEPKQSCI